ncbi:MAG: hypothetical protein QXX35_05355 [Desulfurococcaceae archaeon]
MLFRVKITKCVDIVVEASDLNEVMDFADNLLRECTNAEKVFIHSIDKGFNELIDKGVVYRKLVK